MGEAGGGEGVAGDSKVTALGAWLERQNSHSPNARNPAKLHKSRQVRPSLDFRGLAAINAQPLGSPSR